MAEINKTMFREYDIRGRAVEDQLNYRNVVLIGKAYGAFLRKREIKEAVLGHDSRFTSPEFKEAIKQTIDGIYK